jgi:nucleoside 2-deoxyribosyltransferase
MKKIKIYVGCALAHAPEDFKSTIYAFKELLATYQHIEVLDFIDASLAKPQGQSLESYIYFHDIHNCVQRADIMIADITYPSLGLGWEMGVAVEKCGIPVIMCAREEAFVSRLPRGAAELRDTVSFYQYEERIIEKSFFAMLLEKINKLSE